MIIKQRVSRKCKTCGLSKLVKHEEYGCDNCKKPIDFGKPAIERDYLQITVFHQHREGTDDLEFCSWQCVFEKLKELKTDSFISLPYLSFERTNPEMGVDAFWKAIRECS